MINQIDPPSLPSPIRARAKLSVLAFSCYTLTSNLNFMSPVRIIYLALHGFNPLVIGLLETLLYIVQFGAELPTGIFADLVSKRASLACFCVFTAIQSALFLVPALPFVALSYVSGGLAWAFRGGTNEALVWQMAYADMPTQPSVRYSQLVSRMYILSSLGSVLGPALGGTLGNLLQALPFFATIGISLFSLLPLFFVIEQPTHFDTPSRPRPLSHLRKGFQTVWHDPQLLGLLLLSGLTSSCWHVIFYFSQLYLQSFGFPLRVIGLIIAASTGSYLVFTACAPRMMRLLPPFWLLPLCVVIEGSGLFLMCLPSSVLGLIGYLVLFQAGAALLSPVISTLTNQRSPEAQRVTILSCKTALFDAAMIILFPLFGLGIAKTSYSVVYLWTLGALVVGCGIIWGVTRLRTNLGKRQSFG